MVTPAASPSTSVPLVCAMNVSEGRRADVLAALAEAAGADLLDLHADPHHHRCVLTLAGEATARTVATVAVTTVDIGRQRGVHPRIGAVDVVPFVPVPGAGSTLEDAAAARDRFARWAADELDLPCFLYGHGCARSLPEIRRGAFVEVAPDVGPARPHPTAGAAAVGARPPLVAYNLWLSRPDLDAARRLAAGLRGPHVRTLALAVGADVQVSMNLVSPAEVGPAEVYDTVAAEVEVARAELVGLVPEAVLSAVPPERWAELDLAAERTIEARLVARARAADDPA